MGTSNLGAKEFAGAALVIEDDALIALGLTDMLEQMGFSPISVARTAQDAIERISRDPFAITVVDIKLEGGDGFDVARRLKLNGAPFIFASGYSVRLPADLAGAPFLHKPYNETSLVQAIRTALHGREARP